VPVPPSVTGIGVVSPVSEVISALAPEAAALIAVRAAEDVVAPVPPSVTGIGVVSPVSEVMSVLTPETAAPIAVRAADEVVAPVPPSATVIGVVIEIIGLVPPVELNGELAPTEATPLLVPLLV